MLFWGRSRREDDRVWATTARKIEGLAAEVGSAAGVVDLVLVLAHFEKTRDELTGALDRARVPYRTASAVGEAFRAAHHDGVRSVTALAEAISSPTVAAAITVPKGWTVRIVVAEHHPRLEKDNALLAFARALPCRSRVVFHQALDEPLLKIGGADAERILGLLRGIGWNERQAITHRLITAAIASLQRAAAKGAVGDHRVRSVEEWFVYNYRTPR